MSTVHPEAREGTPPAPVAPSARPSVPRRVRHPVAIVGVVALIVGIAGGYLLRWGTEPTTTVTKTLTAGAYTTTTAAHADVYFDGTTAFYSGPAEVKVGTKLTVHLTTTVNGASVAIGWLHPAPTWEQLVHDIATANTSPAPMPMAYVHDVTSVDGSGDAIASLDRPGVYSVWAGPVSGPAGAATVALATMLRVTE